MEESPSVYLTFSILNFIEAILGIGLGMGYRSNWSVWAWIGHSSYSLMIALTSVWIWLFFDVEESKDAYYAGAQTLKWYMYAVNWIPIGFLTWDVFA